MSIVRLVARILSFLVVLVAISACLAEPALAQDIPIGAGDALPAGTPTPTPSSNSGATVQPGEIGTGNAQAINGISGLFNSVITTAALVSQTVKPEADKFAGGLAVITLVLAFIRFAAASHPAKAWAEMLEELAMLGIFASTYVGYVSFGPSFYNWFGTLAKDISGTDMSSGPLAFAKASGQLYDAFAKSFEGASWYEYPKLLMAVFPLVVAWAVLSITMIVFAFVINIGQLQAAVGIVMGQIAFALGFSSFTRGYFKTWLDYMISGGMYTVVAAILVKLTTATLITAITVAAGAGLSTPQAATYVMDLSFFVFLVSFEIPKMAGMFGGGANASGSIIGKISKAATGGLV